MGAVIPSHQTKPEEFPAYAAALHGASWERQPDGKPRCLVIRFGAIGDSIIASSVLPGLKAQGYYLTYLTEPVGEEVLRHDPHIDEFIVVPKNQIALNDLPLFWEAIGADRYDRVVNLSNSLEGFLLLNDGDVRHGYSRQAIHHLCNVNYLEFAHDIAELPYQFAPKFYPTVAEIEAAKARRTEIKGPVVAWMLHGSSDHKIYPHMASVIAWLLQKTHVHIVLFGDATSGRLIQDGVLNTLKPLGLADSPRVHGLAGKTTVREMLVNALYADCLVGPETGALNAASFEAVPKVIYLSHSSHENLTKHWRNVYVVAPDPALAPCYPCHMLHDDWKHCFKAEGTEFARCANAINPEAIYDSIIDVLIKTGKL
jgi:ADP-heptose:LPS heptosyltransferase